MSNQADYTPEFVPTTQDLVEEGEIAADYLEKFLDILDFEGDLDLDVQNGRALVSLSGNRDTNQLIGHYGKTLNALQYLTRLAVQQKTGHRSKLLFDIDTWREKQKSRLIDYATRYANEVQNTQQEATLRSMSSFERKIIHDALSEFPGIKTGSVGEEPERRVVIYPA